MKIQEIYNREKYDWLDEDVAIITDSSKEKWLMIQDNEELDECRRWIIMMRYVYELTHSYLVETDEERESL